MGVPSLSFEGDSYSTSACSEAEAVSTISLSSARTDGSDDKFDNVKVLLPPAGTMQCQSLPVQAEDADPIRRRADAAAKAAVKTSPHQASQSIAQPAPSHAGAAQSCRDKG